MYKQPTFWLLVSVTMALSLVTRNILLSRQELFHYSKDLPEIMNLVDIAYVDEVKFQELVPGVYQGALEQVDENASYIPPGMDTQDAAEPLLKKTGLVLRKHNGYAYVQSVVAGSPAATAGFIADSYIRDINGESTRHKSLHELRQLLANAKQALEITLVGDSLVDEKRVTLTPDRFKMPEIETKTGDDQIHVVQFATFYRGWKRDLRRAIDAKDRAAKTLLDLRGNANGDLDDLRELAALFFPAGEYGQLQHREGDMMSLANPKAGQFVDRHFFVLVDKSTGAAAERFAAALQVLGQATTVGMATFGFPMVYEDVPLKSGGMVRLATRSWQLSDGKTFTFNGLEPKLALELKTTGKQAKDDAVLNAALTAVHQYQDSKPLQKAG